MVFTTLSSTQVHQHTLLLLPPTCVLLTLPSPSSPPLSPQRVVFRQSAAKAPFHTVLIDEAGQASEVAALQPLVFGAKR